ncbi:MAG: hypothetical protein JNJ61_21520 [Anaerolineae bacterium]|nr:hypothetical protein [Anaerolineae bacterium]
MVISRFMIGLSAGLVLALAFVVYMGVRGRAVAAFLEQADTERKRPTPQTLVTLTGGAVLAAILLGVAASLVYTLIDSPIRFIVLALGAAITLSAAAFVTDTGLVEDKVLLNFVVAVVLGLLVPLLAGF